DEFVDLRADTEHAADGPGKPGSTFDLRAQQTREPKLHRIRHAVEVFVGLGAKPDGRADISDKAVGGRPIVLHDPPGIRAGAKEQLDEPVVEYSEKPRKSVILGEREVKGFLGGRERQCPLRSKQAEKFDKKLQGLVVALHRTSKVGSR